MLLSNLKRRTSQEWQLNKINNSFRCYEDFSILTRQSNDFKLKIMESLLMACDKPCLNKADSSLPLEMF